METRTITYLEATLCWVLYYSYALFIYKILYALNTTLSFIMDVDAIYIFAKTFFT